MPRLPIRRARGGVVLELPEPIRSFVRGSAEEERTAPRDRARRGRAEGFSEASARVEPRYLYSLGSVRAVTSSTDGLRSHASF
jgi:hypothetical protein